MLNYRHSSSLCARPCPKKVVTADCSNPLLNLQGETSSWDLDFLIFGQSLTVDPGLALNPYAPPPTHGGPQSAYCQHYKVMPSLSPCFLVLFPMAELGLVSKTQMASECSRAATLESVLGVPL